MKLTQRFGPIPLTTVLDGSGNGTVTFQSNGSNARVTNLFVKVSTATAQAKCTIYKGQVSDGNAVNTTNSGSTGATASGVIDLTDGETLYVRWTGGDAGAIATATFTGITIPFDQVGPSQLEWDDPIAAADGSLVYPALKSPNYVAGTSGWKIDRDGDAEFNEINVRGSAVFGNPTGERIELTDTGDLEIYTAGGALLATINEEGIKFYNGIGDVVAWIDDLAMTYQDAVGNAIDITTDPAFGALILFHTEDPGLIEIASGRAYATTFPAQDDAPVLVLQSPFQFDPVLRDYARIYIIGADSAANPPKIDFRTGGGPVSVLDGADLIVEGDIDADFVYGSMKRIGQVKNVADDTATSGTTEKTIESVTLAVVNGYTYRLTWVVNWLGSTAGDKFLMRIRVAGGQMTYNTAEVVTAATVVYQTHVSTDWTATSTGNVTFTGTATRNSGTGTLTPKGATSQPRILSVDYLYGA